MSNLRAICVFCGSSMGKSKEIVEVASHLGATMAKRDIQLIYGGAKIGIMGTVADAVLDAGGDVLGVIPEFLKKKEVVHTGLPELIVTKSMHERKLRMQEVSNGYIVLPGGAGTMEEFFEIYTWLQLGLHDDPIGILNVDGFYDGLLEFVRETMERGFLSRQNYELLLVDTTVEGLLAKMESFRPPESPQWLTSETT